MALIFEHLGPVSGPKSQMDVKRGEDGLIHLKGCFGVCGVKNDNLRTYESKNYGERVAELKKRIMENGGIPGELEHPTTMNDTLERISHKIVDVNIDENGVVTGEIALLNTPKGQIAQKIVEGGLPLYISSRGQGSIDSRTGKVTLERLATYDLVGTPGFSQAKLKVNESQCAVALCESLAVVGEKTEMEGADFLKIEESNTDTDMDYKKLEEKIALLEEKLSIIEQYQTEKTGDVANEGVQEWAMNELVPVIAEGVQNWTMNQIIPGIAEGVQNWTKQEVVANISEGVQEWATKELVPVIAEGVQNWAVTDLAESIQQWLTTEFAQNINEDNKQFIVDKIVPAFENWVVNEYSEGLQDWLNEHFKETINKAVTNDKMSLSSLNSILDTLTESLQVNQKPNYQRVVENAYVNEPLFIRQMPEAKRVQWNLASDQVKESIGKKARLYKLHTPEEIANFWESVDFEQIKPATTVFEGRTETRHDNLSALRAQLMRNRNR